jgi:hypothetical protein
VFRVKGIVPKIAIAPPSALEQIDRVERMRAMPGRRR